MLTLIKNRWYFFILGFLTILIFIAILISLISPTKTVFQIQQFSPTPTAIPLNNNSIVNASIQNNATQVDVVNGLQFQFLNNLNSSQQQQVKISLSPQTPFKTQWTNSSLQITPETMLNENTQYTLTLNYADQTKTYNFTTGSLQDISTTEQGILQGRLDDQYSQRVRQQEASFPWLSVMPLQTSQYFVYFDTTQKSFLAILYPNSNSTTPIDKQVENLKAVVITNINSLGNGAQNYPVQWTITPVSE